jgi:phosphoribosylformylglycinamidine synthase
MGAEVDIVQDGADGMRRDFLLFGEDQSRVIVSAAAADGHSLMEIARKHGVPAAVIGRVGGERLLIGKEVDLSVREMARAYMGSIGDRMEKEEVGLF